MAEGALLRVHVQPKASRSRVLGLHGGRLKVAVTAPADRGAANQAVVELLAEELGLSKSDVTLIRGHTSRRKDVLLNGADAGDVTERIRQLTE